MDWSNSQNDINIKYANNKIYDKFEFANLFNGNLNKEVDYEIKQEDFLIKENKVLKKSELNISYPNILYTQKESSNLNNFIP
jgi:hypothetical protein